MPWCWATIPATPMPSAGAIRMVAIHNAVLTPEQIQQNFDVGVGQKYFLMFSVSELIDEEGVHHEMNGRRQSHQLLLRRVPGEPVRRLQLPVRRTLLRQYQSRRRRVRTSTSRVSASASTASWPRSGRPSPTWIHGGHVQPRQLQSPAGGSRHRDSPGERRRPGHLLPGLRAAEGQQSPVDDGAVRDFRYVLSGEVSPTSVFAPSMRSMPASPGSPACRYRERHAQRRDRQDRPRNVCLHSPRLAGRVEDFQGFSSAHQMFGDPAGIGLLRCTGPGRGLPRDRRCSRASISPRRSTTPVTTGATRWQRRWWTAAINSGLLEDTRARPSRRDGTAGHR